MRRAPPKSLSVPLRTLGTMQLTEFDFACEWCSHVFVRRHNRGRRPLYCSRPCRQRAYEDRRRGAYVLGLPKPTVVERLHERPAHYQVGTGGTYGTVAHALRPDGAADRIGFRPALCGARVKPTPRFFHAGRPISGNRNCDTCTNIALRYPAARNIEPLSDIGTAIALIAMLRATRHAPEKQLREHVDLMLAAFGAPGGASLLPRTPWLLERERYASDDEAHVT